MLMADNNVDGDGNGDDDACNSAIGNDFTPREKTQAVLPTVALQDASTNLTR